MCVNCGLRNEYGTDFHSNKYFLNSREKKARKNFRHGIWTHDLCDSGAVLLTLSQLVFHSVRSKPHGVMNRRVRINEIIHMNCGLRNEYGTGRRSTYISFSVLLSIWTFSRIKFNTFIFYFDIRLWEPLLNFFVLFETFSTNRLCNCKMFYFKKPNERNQDTHCWFFIKSLEKLLQIRAECSAALRRWGT